jgi:hypothetical protein
VFDLGSYEAGSFLIDRLGIGLVIDKDLPAVLLHFGRLLIDVSRFTISREDWAPTFHSSSTHPAAHPRRL